MAGCFWFRRFVAAVAIGLLITGTASNALFAGTPDVCERDHHNCGATLQADCCPAAAPATPTNVVGAQTITTAIKLDHTTVAWLSVIAGGMPVAVSLDRHVVATSFSSPPPLPHSDCLVSLLI